MKDLIRCHRCGYENQEGYNFCSKCGASKTPRNLAKVWPEVVDVHPEADLTTLMGEILYYANDMVDWLPSVAEFRQICELKLTENQRQCLYRRYQLHLAGSQKVQKWDTIAKERSGSGGVVKSATETAKSRLYATLTDMRFKANESEVTHLD